MDDERNEEIGSEPADPADGGEGLSEGGSRGDEQRGARATDGAIPQAGGALGGRADPIAGDADEEEE